MEIPAFIQNFGINWIVGHQQLLIGIAAGAVLSHPGPLAVALFNVFVRIPGVGPWMARNPDKAIAWADEFDKAIEERIKKYAKDNAGAPLAAPAGTIPPAAQ